MFGLEETAQFVVDRKIPLQSMVTECVDIENAVDAYQRFDKQDTGKMVISWD